jgi:hypothetical protein
MAKKKEVVSNSDIVPVSDTPSADFFERVAGVIEQARKFVGRTADLTMTVTYFAVGQMIVEREQGGKERAEYGAKILPELSEFLTKRFKNGFSVSTLTNARKFYISYTKQVQTSEPAVSQTLFTKLAVQSKDAISQILSTEFMSHETMQEFKKQIRLRIEEQFKKGGIIEKLRERILQALQAL